jgi:hypothetical protein
VAGFWHGIKSSLRTLAATSQNQYRNWTINSLLRDTVAQELSYLMQRTPENLE